MKAPASTRRKRTRAASFVGQIVLDRLLAVSLEQKIRRKFLRGLRKVLVRLVDPVVVYVLHDQRVSLPLSHDLPFIRQEHPGYMANLVRISSLVFEKYPTRTAIDIGANIGDTVVLIRSAADVPILCIEGDPLYAAFLSDNVARGDVVLEQSFVDATAGVRRATPERSKGTMRMALDEAEGVPISFTTLSEIVRRRETFRDPALVKLDTDGWDAAIIAAEASFFAETRPVIFFEYEPEEDTGSSGGAPFPQLREAGYTHALVYSNTGVYMSEVVLDEDASAPMDALCRRSPAGYCDIAVFHPQDHDVVRELVRGKETLSRTPSKGSVTR